jgi:hypothetical protein
MAVSEENKEIVRMDVGTGEIESRNILNVSSFRVFGVDEKGEKLLGAMSSTGLNSSGESTEYLEWFAIWDTNSGTQVYCSWGSCIGKDDYGRSAIGASADLDAGIIVFFDEFSFSTRTNEVSGSGLVNGPDSDYWWTIGNIAIDSRNDRVAIVYQEGRIEFDEILSLSPWPFNITTAVEEGDKGRLQPIHAALFDRTGKRLAIVRGDQLSIWDVDDWFEKIVYREDVGVIHGIKFSPSGKFLFLGTDDKIKIINLDKNRLESEIETPQITTLDISIDNRLLFWGDDEGNIHVWGVKK